MPKVASWNDSLSPSGKILQSQTCQDVDPRVMDMAMPDLGLRRFAMTWEE
jgi:hypothetical protein